jgi:hypothetical protein
MFLGSRARPVRRADMLPLSVSRLSTQCGILNISQPYRSPRPVTGIGLLLPFPDSLHYSEYVHTSLDHVSIVTRHDAVIV